MAQGSPAALNCGRWRRSPQSGGSAPIPQIDFFTCVTLPPPPHFKVHPRSSSIAPKQLQSTMTPLLLIALLASFLPIIAIAADSNYPFCVNTCISSNPTNSSWCQGSETGRTRTECICRGLLGTPMLNCIRDCDPADQWAFADGLPDACREKVFPEAREGDSTNTGGARRIIGCFGGGLTACVAGVAVVALTL